MALKGVFRPLSLPPSRLAPSLGSLSAGVLVRDHAKGHMVLNDIFGNLEPGVAIESGAELLLIRNLIHEGKYGGVVCYSNAKGSVADNDIWYKGGEGVAGAMRPGCRAPAPRAIWLHRE